MECVFPFSIRVLGFSASHLYKLVDGASWPGNGARAAPGSGVGADGEFRHSRMWGSDLWHQQEYCYHALPLGLSFWVLAEIRSAPTWTFGLTQPFHPGGT